MQLTIRCFRLSRFSIPAFVHLYGSRSRRSHCCFAFVCCGLRLLCALVVFVLLLLQCVPFRSFGQCGSVDLVSVIGRFVFFRAIRTSPLQRASLSASNHFASVCNGTIKIVRGKSFISANRRKRDEKRTIAYAVPSGWAMNHFTRALWSKHCSKYSFALRVTPRQIHCYIRAEPNVTPK